MSSHLAPSAATVHATPHGQTGTAATPHDAAHAVAHAGALHGNDKAHAAAKDKAAAGGATRVPPNNAGTMTDSKGGKYKIAPSGKKQYLGK